MLEPGIVITRITEEARWTDAGKNQPLMRVEFKVGDHGPFTEKFDKTTYTALDRDQRLNTFAREVRST